MIGYKYKGGGEFPEYTGNETTEDFEVRGGKVWTVVKNFHTRAEVSATLHPNQGWAECRQVLRQHRERELDSLTQAAWELLTKDQKFLSTLRQLEIDQGSPLVFRVVVSKDQTHYYLEKAFDSSGTSWDSWGSYSVERVEEVDELAHTITLIQSQGYSVILPE